MENADDFIAWLRRKGFDSHFRTHARKITAETEPPRVDLAPRLRALSSEVMQASGDVLERILVAAQNDFSELHEFIREAKVPPGNHLLPKPEATLDVARKRVRFVLGSIDDYKRGVDDRALRVHSLHKAAKAVDVLHESLGKVIARCPTFKVPVNAWPRIEAEICPAAQRHQLVADGCKDSLDVAVLADIAAGAGLDPRLVERALALHAEALAHGETDVFIREMREAWNRSVIADPTEDRFHAGAGLVQAFSNRLLVRAERFAAWRLWQAHHQPDGSIERHTAASIRVLFAVCCTAVRWASKRGDDEKVVIDLLGHLLRQTPRDRSQFKVPNRWFDEGGLTTVDVGPCLRSFFNIRSAMDKKKTTSGPPTPRNAWLLHAVPAGVIRRDAAAAAALWQRLGDAWPIALISKTAAMWREETEMKQRKLHDEPVSIDGGVVRRGMTVRIADIANYLRAKGIAPGKTTLPIEAMASRFFNEAAPQDQFSSRAHRGAVDSWLMGSTVDRLVLQAADELRGDAERLRQVFCRAWTERSSWQVFQLLATLRDASPMYGTAIWSPIAVAARITAPPADMDAKRYFAG